MAVRTAEHIMAIDYGSKRVGIALAHKIARFPHPLITLDNTDTLLEDIVALARLENVGILVVGLPVGLDGNHTAQTETCAVFAIELAHAYDASDIAVYTVEETLSSAEAEQRLGAGPYKKGAVDAMAASIILERYFEQNQPEQVV